MRAALSSTSLALALAASAHASFTVIKGVDNWNAQVGPCTTLDFVFPTPKYLSTQYASLGAIFEGDEYAYDGPPNVFQQDGWGCGADDGSVDITFLSPQYAIGAWFPGDLWADLYWQGQIIYQSPNLNTFPLSYAFGGVLSTQPFDHVRLHKGFTVAVDDVLFIPSPGAMGLIALAGAAGGRRRRGS